MRIPSGDLAPLRRRRRRRRRVVPLLLVVVLLAVGGGAHALRQDDRLAETVAHAGPCPPPSAAAPAAGLPRPAAVRLRLLNGTGRDGLARAVRAELARRGFVVTLTADAPRPLTGPSVVTYGPGARPAATLVAAHAIGATLLPVPGAARGSVDLTLGSGFVRLRRVPEVSAFLTPALAKEDCS